MHRYKPGILASLTALACSLALLAFLLPADARQAFPADGGHGDANTTDECPQGWYVIGFKGRAEGWIDQIALICARFNADYSIAERRQLPARGGAGGRPVESNCPRGSVVTGVQYNMTKEWRQTMTIFAQCMSLAGGGKSNIRFGKTDDRPMDREFTLIPQTGDDPVPLPSPEICGEGDAAIGMQIHYGRHVGATGLICDELIRPKPEVVAVPCKQGEVWRERTSSDLVCVHPDQRWVMADGSCRQGWVKLGVGPKKDTCVTPETKKKADADAAAAAARVENDKLRSGNPQDFAGTWNTTRRGETLILTLRVDGTNVTGEFTNPSRPSSNGTLTGTIKTYDGNFGRIVKLSYVSPEPTQGDGSFDVFTDGRIEGGFTWREPGKAKKTFIRWEGTRAAAANKGEAAGVKDKVQSGNPQDFAGTWNTTRRGENLILTLRVDGTNVTGEFTNPSRPSSNGTLTGTIKTYDGDSGPIVKLSYVSKQPTVGDGSFDVFTDGRLEGGFTWREPGKAKKTFIRWNGRRASN